MSKLTESSRLKVKEDTFFFPEPNGVYFRNNVSSFSMKGSSIAQWVERLVPMFSGEHTLDELTQGLPPQYRERVYEIGEALYLNGFAKDVSKNRPHCLERDLINKYASQIEFIENFVDSGAFRFQLYRQTKVLTVGSGSLFVSLISSLIESGMTKIHMAITDFTLTDRTQLNRLREIDPKLEIKEVSPENTGADSWREIMEPYEWILYVSQNGNIEELRTFHAICREEKKQIIPIIVLKQTAIVGPFVHPESNGDWESAWRRVNRDVLYKKKHNQSFSSTVGAMLANIATFELFKVVTGVTESEERNQFFLFDLETLEGRWHSFLPHPLVNQENAAPGFVQDFTLKLKEEANLRKSSDLLHHFAQITSDVSGIFYQWEEGELKQLPLSQCRVQVVDPLSEGPAKSMPSIICSGMTFEETQREAGLTGIEIYTERMKGFFTANSQDHEINRMISQDYVGIGTGETIAEAISRGLQKCLEELYKQKSSYKGQSITHVQLRNIQDEHCKFYFQTLSTMNGDPIIGLGEKVCGFPVVWVGTNGYWYGSVGLNQTTALKKALQTAIMEIQNSFIPNNIQRLELSSFILEDRMELTLDIPSSKDLPPSNDLQSALKTLKENRQKPFILNLPIEPFLIEKLVGVFGVVLRKEESL